jgi:hypothetical protein
VANFQDDFQSLKKGKIPISRRSPLLASDPRSAPTESEAWRKNSVVDWILLKTNGDDPPTLKHRESGAGHSCCCTVGVQKRQRPKAAGAASQHAHESRKRQISRSLSHRSPRPHSSALSLTAAVFRVLATMAAQRLGQLARHLSTGPAPPVPAAVDAAAAGDDPLLFGAGTETTNMSVAELRAAVKTTLDQLGPRERVLVIPPDFTRAHSQGGIVTRLIYEYYGDRVKDILPALGSHDPVSTSQFEKMFEGVPPELFRVHDWRNDVVTLGEVPAEFVEELTEGRYSHAYPVQVNKLVQEGGHDLIISVGQVVPHEVAGMANHTKNMLVGCGGKDAIDQSHYIGAVYGMERIMGRYDNPVRKLYNKAWSDYASHLPVCWMQTVCSKDEATDQLAIRGFYTGMGYSPFVAAAELALKSNFIMLGEEITKAVVYLDPEEFHTTWLGNKAIYRTRMAMADGGELVVLAPAVERFGEDMGIDKIIRKCECTCLPPPAPTQSSPPVDRQLSHSLRMG